MIPLSYFSKNTFFVNCHPIKKLRFLTLLLKAKSENICFVMQNFVHVLLCRERKGSTTNVSCFTLRRTTRILFKIITCPFVDVQSISVVFYTSRYER